jgi:hypothetical protein
MMYSANADGNGQDITAKQMQQWRCCHPHYCRVERRPAALIPISPLDGMPIWCWCLHHHHLTICPSNFDVSPITAGWYAGPAFMSTPSPPDGTPIQRWCTHHHRMVCRSSMMSTSSPPDGMPNWHWCLPHHHWMACWSSIDVYIIIAGWYSRSALMSPHHRWIECWSGGDEQCHQRFESTVINNDYHQQRPKPSVKGGLIWNRRWWNFL